MAEIMYEKEIEYIKKDFTEEEKNLIEKAFKLAEKGHINQKRKSGEPYIIHCIEVAKILKELNMDAKTIAAGFLHDLVEDTEFNLEHIKNEINEEVAFLIEGVSYVTAKVFKTKGEIFTEALRKMFLAMSKDIRVIIIKLADRLHNLRTIQYLEEENQKRIAYETLNIYAPLAHRFGMQKIKSELEDISFKILYPEQYKLIKNKIDEKKLQNENKIKLLTEKIKNELEKNNIKAEIYGRIKHFYSIFQKMQRENKTIDNIYDILAIRIITDDIPNCYAILGHIHNILKPIPGRVKDYIAMPKKNLYQALHTTVMDEDGFPIEVQIRTYDMDKIAEQGIAAHWLYKEHKKFDFKLDNYFSWIKQILELQKNLRSGEDFIKELKMDLFDEEIFVFTPKGEVKEFIKGATVLDFAYSIHSDIGDKCIGAKVNGKWVSFKYELNNGDMVEILTGANQHPTLDWLKIVKTAKARNRIRHWLKININPQESIEKGKELLNFRLNNSGISIDKIPDEIIKKILSLFNFNKKEDLFLGIGIGEISEIKISNKILRFLRETTKKEEKKIKLIERKKDLKSDLIIEDNLSDIVYRFAKCCNPIPGDKIKAILTKKGLSVHREGCINLKKVSTPLINIEWNKSEASNYYSSKIEILAEQRKEIIQDIIIEGNKKNIFIPSINSTMTNGNMKIELTIKIKNMENINEFFNSLKYIKGIKDIKRIM